MQTIREFERQLADAQSEVQRLERENENLEGQVEQLAISLMDATSKKTDSELRLRQLQQVRIASPFSVLLDSPRPRQVRSLDRHQRPDNAAHMSTAAKAENVYGWRPQPAAAERHVSQASPSCAVLHKHAREEAWPPEVEVSPMPTPVP